MPSASHFYPGRSCRALSQPAHLGGLAVGVPTTAASPALVNEVEGIAPARQNRSSQVRVRNGSRRILLHGRIGFRDRAFSADPQANDFHPNVPGNSRRRAQGTERSFVEHREVGIGALEQRAPAFDCPPTRVKDRSADRPAVIFPSSSWRPLKLLPEWPLRSWLFRMPLSSNSTVYPSEGIFGMTTPLRMFSYVPLMSGSLALISSARACSAGTPERSVGINRPSDHLQCKHTFRETAWRNRHSGWHDL